jgi:hypothetical protein
MVGRTRLETASKTWSAAACRSRRAWPRSPYPAAWGCRRRPSSSDTRSISRLPGFPTRNCPSRKRAFQVVPRRMGLESSRIPRPNGPVGLVVKAGWFWPTGCAGAAIIEARELRLRTSAELIDSTSFCRGISTVSSEQQVEAHARGQPDPGLRCCYSSAATVPKVVIVTREKIVNQPVSTLRYSAVTVPTQF